MTGLTDFVTRAAWVDIFTIWCVVVDGAYRLLEAQYGRWCRRGEPPVFRDSEVITVALFEIACIVTESVTNAATSKKTIVQDRQVRKSQESQF